MAEDGPLGEGLITFVPLPGTTGPKVSASIEGGRYAVAADQGLQPGDFKVEVYGLPPGVKAMAEGRHPPRGEEDYREVSPEFNSQSRLAATLTAGANREDFRVRRLPP